MSAQPSTREHLGTTYCERCKLDTLPDELTGECLFCGDVLVEPFAELFSFPVNRVRCRCGHGVGAHDDVDGICAGCPCALFTPAEVGK